MKEYGENSDGVHLMFGEYAVCGDAFDVGATDDEVDDIEPTLKRVVTCQRCVRTIEYCRNVRVRKT